MIFKSTSFDFLSQVKMNSINWSAPKIWVVTAQLVEHYSANAEAMGSNPVEKILRAKICNCLNCDYNSDDHISISYDLFFFGYFINLSKNITQTAVINITRQCML